MKYRLILRFLAIISGIVFLLSGLLKGVDPEGTAIKLTEYFEAASVNIPWIIALILSLILISVEFITGFFLITSVKLKWGIPLFFAFMLVFTPVTLILALSNPVSDCGCFGDAVKLTNWQTFFKNLPLLIISLLLFLRRKEITSGSMPQYAPLNTIVAILAILVFQIYNIIYLPVVDFRPYHIGANLIEKQEIPEDATHDRYETTFIYEKDGTQQEFTLENYPSGDTTWKFIDQKSVLIERGFVPEISGLALIDPSAGDITDQILNDNQRIVLMIAPNIRKMSDKAITKAYSYRVQTEKEGGRFYLVTASPESYILESGLQFEVLYADETLLKTIIRSNPGFLTIENGIIIEKNSWSGLSIK